MVYNFRASFYYRTLLIGFSLLSIYLKTGWKGKLAREIKNITFKEFKITAAY